jgi:hypothetical protein
VTRLREAGLLMTEAEFVAAVESVYGPLMTEAEFAAMLPEWDPGLIDAMTREFGESGTLDRPDR